MIFSAIIKGIAIGLILAISVGPVIFAIIRQSLSNGHKGGLFFVTGVSSSDILLVLLCNFFTELFNSNSTGGWLQKLIGYGGSCFLIILGLINFFAKAKVVATQEAGETHKVLTRRNILSIYFSGFLMNTLNPAVILFWIATSASIMVDANKYNNHFHNDILYRFIVFIVCLGFTLSTDICKVFLAGKIRKRLTAHNIHIINRISGIIFIVFGCILLYSIYTGHNFMNHK